MQILLTKTISVFTVPVEFPKSLVNKMVLFWSTEFHLLTNRFLTTQNHWKPFNTIECKKADFSVLSKLLKDVEKAWKSAMLERVTGSEFSSYPLFIWFCLCFCVSCWQICWQNYLFTYSLNFSSNKIKLQHLFKIFSVKCPFLNMFWK